MRSEEKNYFAEITYLRYLRNITFKELCIMLDRSPHWLREQLKSNNELVFIRCKRELMKLNRGEEFENNEIKNSYKSLCQD